MRFDASVWRLEWERPALFARIAERCDQMLENGWLEETQRMRAQGLFDAPTAWQALGYKYIAKYLDGLIDADEMRMRIVSDTKKYARRQDTWFKNKHPEAQVLHMPEQAQTAVDTIIDSL